jgi:short-subunit dehydrogenase
VSTDPHPKSILITGASGAIGSALALQYAASGKTLILFGRKNEKLEQIATACIKRGAEVEIQTADIVDRISFMELLQQICEHKTPDLIIANAGVSSTATRAGETWQAIEEVVAVNILGVMAMVQVVVPYMKKRGSGQIALISSLAGWYGLPVTPAYSASKAAIKNYGEALRIALAPHGIRVNVILPGFVDSAMSQSVPGHKPFLLTGEQAAKTIQQGLTSDRSRISFPFPLNFGSWWLAVLPASISGWILQKTGYHV